MTKYERNITLSLTLSNHELGLGRKRSEITGDGAVVERNPDISIEQEIALYELGLGKNRIENDCEHSLDSSEVQDL